MKPTGTILLILICSSLFAQKGIKAINGFKYAYVVILEYGNQGKDIYRVTEYLKNELSKKGIVVLADNFDDWPQEAKIDQCLVGQWLPSNSPGGIPNSANAGYRIMNCKNEIIYEEEAFSTRIGAYYPQNSRFAIKKSFKSILSFNYKFDKGLTPTIDFPIVESTTETEQSLKTYFSENGIDPIEGIYKSYQSETMGYYKLGIKKREGKYIAIIIESDLKHWKPGEIKAYFEVTSLKNIFSTTWLRGNKIRTETFSEFENEGILSIEFDDPETREKTQSEFIKLYPFASTSVSSKPSNIKVTGSGFAITPSGVIATNAHVIEGSDKFEVSFSNEFGSFTYQAKLLLKDASNDIALLKIEDTKFKEFNEIPYIVNEKTDIGEQVFTIGYPLNSIMGENYKVTNGIISANSGIEDDIRFLQISVPIQPGNSGGPLFDKNGNIVGLTTAKLNPEAVGTNVENVNYAIKASYLLNLLKMIPDNSSNATKSQLTNMELKDQVKILKNYVCLIKVY